MDKETRIAKVKELLTGMDKCETESEDGWWETSAGAEFGSEKLLALIKLLEGEE